MHPLYTEEDFKNAKRTDKLPFKCLNCSNTFYRWKGLVNDHLNPNRQDKIDFCSYKCVGQYKFPAIYKNCETCNTQVQVTKYRLRTSKHIFCSKKCAGKYSSTHRKHGYKISKLEIWIQKKLTELFPALEILFNQNGTIKNELDIYIPSLKLAFELNGVFHYKPIYGEEGLENQKRIDLLKIEKCRENNINLTVIDISSQQCFKEDTSLVYLNQIVEIIKLAEEAGYDPANPC